MATLTRRLTGSACAGHAAIIVCLLVASVLFWHRIVFTPQTLFSNLTYRFFYPSYSLLAQAVHHRELPLWNPFIYSGMPFLANAQAAVFYPFTYLFVLFEFPRALTLFLVLHTFLAGLFMFYLARECGRSHCAAFAAAFLFMFNGFSVLHATFPSNVASMTWLPLIVLFFTGGVERNSLTWYLLAGLFLAVQFLGGHPQFCYYTLLFLVAWLAYAALVLRSHAQLARGLTAFAVALLVLIALVMVQLLPFAELAALSVRGGGLDLASASVFSIPLSYFVRFIFCPLWDWSPLRTVGADIHIVGFYFGYCALGLLVVSACCKPCSFEKFLYGTLIAALLLSLGTQLPFYGWFYTCLPGWRFLRFPAQALSLGLAPAGLLAGCGLDKITHRWLRPPLVAALFVELTLFGMKAHRLVDSSMYRVVSGTVSFLAHQPGLFRFMLIRDARSKPLRPAGDQFRFSLNYEDMLYPNSGSAYGLFDADGDETFRLRRYAELTAAIHDPSSRLLDLLNVKYLVSFRALCLPKYTLARDGYLKTYENNDCLPRFFLVPRARFLPEKEILPYLRSASFDPAHEVVIEAQAPHGPGTTGTEGASGGTVVVESYALNDIALRVTSPFRQWLVLSETYFPGWRALVDGRPVSVYRANHALRAIALDSGEHAVRFTYAPHSFGVGALVSSAAAFTLLVVFVRMKRRKHGDDIRIAANQATLAGASALPSFSRGSPFPHCGCHNTPFATNTTQHSKPRRSAPRCRLSNP